MRSISYRCCLLAALSLAVACGDDDGDDGGQADAASTADAATDAASGADADPTADAAADAGGDVAGMVQVPAGNFLMGSLVECEACDADEKPQHSVTLSAFYIDITEVTQAAYAECTEASACTFPSDNFDPAGTPNHPVVNVTWDQAVEYCEWAGKRLPTEAEWEKAARGTDGRLYPWGDDEIDDCTTAVTSSCGGNRLPVGQLAAGASPYGALDMAGNAWEWTADYYAEDAYADHDGADPQGPATGTQRVYRGGSAGNLITLARTANRADTYNPAVGGSGLGFRCAL